MANLIAIHSIRRREPVKKSGPGQKDKFNTVTIASGESFTESDENEARRLIAMGAARQAPLPLPPLGASEKPAGDPLDRLSDDELAKLAADRSLTLKPGASRVDMVAALNKATA
ncbi:MAG: hypothetical protein Q8L13_11730 [Bradyrhizobium sp.]|uniref:hypothetical protein n=1 Tax=Bradyrhizobium sp. TaxID=376 RepID=UPI0027315C4F|nr:hypothetical protein [Bradyrhizobium sp.]MDP1866995.1 hypothetical protein [Bradyrhizobium sp.]